jgi:hypothetical protein
MSKVLLAKLKEKSQPFLDNFPIRAVDVWGNYQEN